MAKKLISIQTEKGHWAMSLLKADVFQTPETSGSSFFTYGLAWGLNNGILDEKEYLKPVIKAWQFLSSHVSDEGYWSMYNLLELPLAMPGRIRQKFMVRVLF